MEYQRANGSFFWAKSMVISTLEYNFYALSIIQGIGVL
jgi:hypothetical protein